MSSPEGELTVDGDLATLSFERRLPYPVEAVWSAITDPEERGRWFGETTDIATCRHLGQRVALVTRQLDIGRSVSPAAAGPATTSAPTR